MRALASEHQGPRPAVLIILCPNFREASLFQSVQHAGVAHQIGSFHHGVVSQALRVAFASPAASCVQLSTKSDRQAGSVQLVSPSPEF